MEVWFLILKSAIITSKLIIQKVQIMKLSLILVFIFILLNFNVIFCQQSIDQTTISDSTMIKSFKQGIGRGFVVGNCASISVIKLAIKKYGLDNVLLHVDTLPERYFVELRDGKKIELTKQEEKQINEIDYFSNPNDSAIYRQARFLYAVMAKNKYLENAGNYSDIVGSAKRRRFLRGPVYLLGDTEPNLRYLGLENNYDTVDIANINTTSDIILTNYYHSAYSSRGLYDEYGGPTANSKFVSNHGSKKLNVLGIYQLKN